MSEPAVDTPAALAERVHRNRLIAGALALAGVVVVCYAALLGNGFIHADLENIVTNESLQKMLNWRTSLGERTWWEGLAELGEAFPGDTPFLVWLSYGFNFLFSTEEPVGYLATNLLLLGFNVLILYFLVHGTLHQQSGRETSEGWDEVVAAATIALLFALHPLQAGVVGYVSARPSLISTALVLGGLSLFRIGLREALASGGSRLGRVLATICALIVLGVCALSGTPPLLLAALVPIYDWAFVAGVVDRGNPHRLRTRAIFYAVLAAGTAFAFVAQARIEGFTGVPGAATEGYGVLATHAVAMWRYLALLLWPVDLAIDHLFATWDSFFAPAPLFALGGHALYLGVAGWLAMRNRHRLAGSLLALWLSLLAITGTVPLAEPLVEHRALIVLPWFVAALSALWRWVAARSTQPILWRWAPLIVLLVLGTLSIARVITWQTPRGIWEEARATDPENPRPWFQLGVLAMSAGDDRAALDLFADALRRDADFAPAAINRGVLLLERGDLENAERNFRRALEAEPGSVPALYNLAETLEKRGALDEALEIARRLRKQEPTHGAFAELEGRILARLGRIDDALARYEFALAQGGAGERQELMRRTAYLAYQHGDTERARKWFERAIRDYPQVAENWFNLGVFNEQQEEIHEAISSYRRALVIDPAFAKAHFNLARLLEIEGECDEAGRHYRVAALYAPEYRAPWEAFRAGREAGERCPARGPFGGALPLP